MKQGLLSFVAFLSLFPATSVAQDGGSGKDAGWIIEIGCTALLKKDEASDAVKLDRSKDKGRRLHAGELLMCSGDGILRVNLHSRSLDIKKPQGWYPIPENNPGPEEKKGTGGRTGAIWLKGTYRLSALKGEQLNPAVLILPDGLRSLFQPYSDISIEIRDKKVTIVPSDSPGISFIANGVEHPETNQDGQSLRLSARINSDYVTISCITDVDRVELTLSLTNHDQVTLQARHGNELEKPLVKLAIFDRLVPREPPRVVVLATGANATSWMTDVTTKALENIINQNESVELISSAQRDSILSGLAFNTASGLLDSQQAVRLGALLAARYIVIGNVLDVTRQNTEGGVDSGDLGSEIKIRVQVQTIDAETGVVKFSKSFEQKAIEVPTELMKVTGNYLERRAYRKAMETIATQFSGEFSESFPAETLVRRRDESRNPNIGKPRIVVLATGSSNTLWTTYVTIANLEDAILQSGRFELITGAHRDKLLREQGFNNSDVADPQQATKVGKLLSARYIIVGNAFDVTVKQKGGGFSPIDVGSEVKSRVQIQMIDAETGIVKISKSFEQKVNKGPVTGTQTDNDAIHDAYRKAMEMIATQFVGELGASVPTETLVLLVRGGRVALDLGGEQVKVGQEFEVFSQDEPILGPDGKPRGYITTKYARLRIAVVESQLSWATVVATYDENGAADAQIKIDRIKKNLSAKRVK
jgi:curli biogenesis system outer membrane secretion channel CsgG